MVQIGSFDVRWTTPVSHYAVPLAFWAASRHIKLLSGPVLRLAADSLALEVILF